MLSSLLLICDTFFYLSCHIMFPFSPPSLTIHQHEWQAYKDIRRTQRETKKTMRKTDEGPLASVKFSAILTEGVVEDGRKNDTPPFSDGKKLFGRLVVCSHTHIHTHAQTQQCWQENSLLPGRSIHLLLPLCLCACTIGYWHTQALFCTLFCMCLCLHGNHSSLTVKQQWVSDMNYE